MGKRKLTAEEKLDRRNARRNVIPLLGPKAKTKNYLPDAIAGPLKSKLTIIVLPGETVHSSEDEEEDLEQNDYQSDAQKKKQTEVEKENAFHEEHFKSLAFL